MFSRLVFTILAAVTLTSARGNPKAVQLQDSSVQKPNAIVQLVASIRETARARDSLAALAKSASGTTRDVLEESIWQQQQEIHAGVIDIADKIEEEQSRGGDVTAARLAVSEAVREGWPRYQIQLRRWERELAALSESTTSATGAQRSELESKRTQDSDRIVEAYQSLVDEVLTLERVKIDVSEPRAMLVSRLPQAAEGLVARTQLASRDRGSAGARLSRDPTSMDLRYSFEAADERLKRNIHALSTAITLMDRLHIKNTDLRVALIAITGRITADVFRWDVFVGLLKTMWGRFMDFLARKAPQWLFQGLMIALTFFGFRALSQLVRRVARRAVDHAQFSQLLRSTIVRLSANAVMVIGFAVILTQLGVQVAPLLAGLGIAGFVVGFAMQNTLSNFAAGGMILGNQPFDVGDEIEVAGVTGTVKRMTLVSTTILTPDNQTLIIPNSTVWGGVIRNRTAQPLRRVDLTFSIGYGDDIGKAERVLRELVTADQRILNDPAPLIKLDQLADSSVNFVVRVWTEKDQYWEVYWDLTRGVKVGFDREGITIPFPQREVHMNVAKAGGAIVGQTATPSA